MILYNDQLFRLLLFTGNSTQVTFGQMVQDSNPETYLLLLLFRCGWVKKAGRCCVDGIRVSCGVWICCWNSGIWWWWWCLHLWLVVMLLFSSHSSARTPMTTLIAVLSLVPACWMALQFMHLPLSGIIHVMNNMHNSQGGTMSLYNGIFSKECDGRAQEWYIQLFRITLIVNPTQVTFSQMVRDLNLQPITGEVMFR